MKPGNSVEDKTLTTETPCRESLWSLQGREQRQADHGGTRNPWHNRKGARRKLSTYRSRVVGAASCSFQRILLMTRNARTPGCRHPGVGSRGREVRMTTLESRHREGPKKPENGMGMARSNATPRRRRAEVSSHSGLGAFPAISNAGVSRRM